MRKKTINHLFDNAMWYIIYLLPLVIFIGVSIRVGEISTLSNSFNLLGLGVLQDSVIFTALSSIFGVGGVVPLFANADILLYFSYFISVYLVHLCVDFLLFIPRMSHKWLKSFTSGGAD